ncbi:MAG TPA: hemolysin family protein [Candidatus Krumholzibacteria bacterium]|nr:hemolysin family protein [Candidatus Krumholzibacteria bacterium]HPD71078.1 hemolysin family protein [Candidatus Krumholzibacteria bacterium]HRY39222.1 hemolysin family protein [Candidatus Krumholzibacteria bacterium]
MEFLLLCLLLLLSATFSASETAFFALTATERSQLRQRGGAAHHAALLIERHANDLLSAILLGNLVVNVAAGAVATSICLREFGPNGLAVAVPAATLLILMAAEITPKLIALRGRQRLAVALQAPLRAWVTVTSPVVRRITTAVERVLRRVPWERTGSRPFTTLELQTACSLAAEDGALTETEGNFLARLLQLEDLEVKHVMTPRPDVVALERGWGRARILAVIRRARFNRFPVVDAAGAMPGGLFHTKDLLTNTDRQPLQGALRPLLYVPESKDVAAVLAEMRSGAGHLAAVVDEHGDFTGIVTLADCLQALIGRVGDPSEGRLGTLALGPGRWLVDGGLDLRELHEATGLELPPSRDYVTVAGFVMARLGRIPAVDDRVPVGEAALTVVAMQGRRVASLRVERPPERREGRG